MFTHREHRNAVDRHRQLDDREEEHPLRDILHDRSLLPLLARNRRPHGRPGRAQPACRRAKAEVDDDAEAEVEQGDGELGGDERAEEE